MRACKRAVLYGHCCDSLSLHNLASDSASSTSVGFFICPSIELMCSEERAVELS